MLITCSGLPPLCDPPDAIGLTIVKRAVGLPAQAERGLQWLDWNNDRRAAADRDLDDLDGGRHLEIGDLAAVRRDHGVDERPRCAGNYVRVDLSHPADVDPIAAVEYKEFAAGSDMSTDLAEFLNEMPAGNA